MPISDDQKRRIEVEVAVRDMFSGALREMGKEMEAFNKKAAEGARLGSDALADFLKHNESVGEGVKKNTGHLFGLNKVIGDLTKQIAGPIGLVSAIGMIAKSLDTFAVSQMQLKSLATDTGLTQTQIQQLRLELMKTGLSFNEATDRISKFGDVVNSIATYRQGSPFWQSLERARGGTALAEQVRQLGEQGKQYEAIMTIIERFQDLDPAGQQFMADWLGMKKSMLSEMSRTRIEAAKVFVPTPEEQAEEKRLHEELVVIKQRFWDEWERVNLKGAAAVNKSEDLLRGLFGMDRGEGTDENARGIGDRIREHLKNLFGGGKAKAEGGGAGDAQQTEDETRARDSTKKLGDISDTLHRIEDPEGYRGGDKGGADAGGGGGGGGGQETSGPASSPPPLAGPKAAAPPWPSTTPAPLTPTPTPEAVQPPPETPSAFNRAVGAVKGLYGNIVGGLRDYSARKEPPAQARR